MSFLFLYRYELSFKVSDDSQGQFGVEAKVTVEVKTMNPADVKHATPLTLAVNPNYLVKADKVRLTFLILTFQFISLYS